jgi:hypothetical protein
MDSLSPSPIRAAAARGVAARRPVIDPSDQSAHIDRVDSSHEREHWDLSRLQRQFARAAAIRTQLKGGHAQTH